MVLAIAAALLFQLIPSFGASNSAVTPTVKPQAQAQAETVQNLPGSSGGSQPLFASNIVQIGSGADAQNFPGGAAGAGSRLSGISFSSAVLGSPSLSIIRVAAPGEKPSPIIPAISLASRRKWLALTIAEHSAAAFDAATTRLAIGQGAVEKDPLMRPFAGSPAIYAAIQVAPVVLDFTARRMQRSSNGFMRRSWWMPQSIATGMFLFSGAHNLQVASQLH